MHMKNNDRKWNQASKASPEDLYEQVDLGVERHGGIKAGLAMVGLAVAGLFGGGCAADANEPTDEVKTVMDKDGNLVQPTDPSNKDEAKQDQKSTKTRTCNVQLQNVRIQDWCQND
jgi:hypothetical protein